MVNGAETVTSNISSFFAHYGYFISDKYYNVNYWYLEKKLMYNTILMTLINPMEIYKTL